MIGDRERLIAAKEALKALLDATDPYIEEAAPGETLTSPWLDRFGRLCEARRLAADAVEEDQWEKTVDTIVEEHKGIAEGDR